MSFAAKTFGLLLALVAAAWVGAWSAASASTGGPPGPVPVAAPVSTPPPTSPPSSSHPSQTHIIAPHVWISEGTFLVDKTIYPPQDTTGHCGAAPLKWASAAASDLRAGFTSEKAYFQENDVFSSPSAIGFAPESWDRACINFVATVGHYTGDPNASVFFITARHNTGGAMYCVASIGGTLTAGAIGTSSAGGPILNPEQCAALPQFVPPSTYFPPTATAATLPMANPQGSSAAAVSPALTKAATPYNLNTTNDLTTCTQHMGSQSDCEFDIVGGRAIMVWTAGTSCGDWRFCTTRIAGYRIYSEPRVASKTIAPAPDLHVSQSVQVTSSTSTAVAMPTATPNIRVAPMPLQTRVLMATITGSATAATLYASDLKPGKCFAVVAYLASGDESDDSPQYCVSGPVAVGPQNLDLTPSVLVTAYGHGSNCSGAPPFAHPGGYIIAGYSVTAGTNDWPSGYRCRQNEGLMKFDLSGISPPLVYKAVLTYSKGQNYKLDGSLDPSPGICVPTLWDTLDDWASSASDPRAGLVNVHGQIDHNSSSDFYHTDITTTVNAMLQSGINNGFVMRTVDWNGPGSNCFTSFGDFHLIITAFGHK